MKFDQRQMLLDYNRKRILDPGGWPLWPYLPVKNVKETDPQLPGTPLTGIITSTDVEAGRFRVRIGLIFFRYSAEEFAALPVREYPDIDAFFAAGWLGD